MTTDFASYATWIRHELVRELQGTFHNIEFDRTTAQIVIRYSRPISESTMRRFEMLKKPWPLGIGHRFEQMDSPATVQPIGKGQKPR